MGKVTTANDHGQKRSQLVPLVYKKVLLFLRRTNKLNLDKFHYLTGGANTIVVIMTFSTMFKLLTSHSLFPFTTFVPIEYIFSGSVHGLKLHQNEDFRCTTLLGGGRTRL